MKKDGKKTITYYRGSEIIIPIKKKKKRKAKGSGKITPPIEKNEP